MKKSSVLLFGIFLLFFFVFCSCKNNNTIHSDLDNYGIETNTTQQKKREKDDFEIGYDEGYHDAEAEHEEDYFQGFDDGYDEGYAFGYDEGYSAGYAQHFYDSTPQPGVDYD